MQQRNLSRNIEQYILSLLDGELENFVTLRRKDLAEKFECVPSQINYVLRSRFRPEHGYMIDSRRGEHGYIKIVRITYSTPEEKAQHSEDVIGDTISLKESHRMLENLANRNFITQRERLLMEISLRHEAMIMEDEKQSKREEMYAELLKRMLRSLMLLEED